MDIPKAILLVGPTGAGKSPLGELLEQQGLYGRRCIHFDFGRELRAIAAGELRSAQITGADVKFIRDVLEAGALLEDENFPVARRVFEAYTGWKNVQSVDTMVMNGLPRHLGQAADAATLVDIRMVVYLDCVDEAVRQRIRTDAGGDRKGRADDAADAVSKKLRTFRERTVPLLDHYRNQKIRLVRVEVTPRTTPQEILRMLAEHPEPALQA